jgi:hypothetical protein
MKTPNPVTIVISSCDDYSDIWEPFFYLFKKYWEPVNYPIVFNTETKIATTSGLDIKTINSNKEWTWSRRLRYVISQVDSPYILLLLDDFFLYDKVDTKRIEQCVEWMSKDRRIANITFFKTGIDGIVKNPHPEFALKKRKSLYKVNAVAGIWRKTKLLKYLKDDENAWQFEQNGTERSWRSFDKFYYLSDGEDRIIPYDFTEYGLFGGKWLKPTIDLFKKEKITMDFGTRGMYKDYERALSKSMAGILKLDSIMEVDTGAEVLTRHCMIRPPVTHFVQTYKFRNIHCDSIVWRPSSNYGYALKNLEIKLTHSDGGETILNNNRLSGNYTYYHDKSWFLHYCPSVIINTEVQRLERITITGDLDQDINRDDLKHAYAKHGL